MPLTKKCFCTVCRQITNHEVLHEGEPITRHEEQYADTGFVFAGDKCDLYKCKGCENHVMVKTFWHDDFDPEEFSKEYYPPIEKHPVEGWHKALPEGVLQLSHEVISAINHENYILAVMGCRSLIDLFANEIFKMDHGTFKCKIEELEDKGHISKNDKEIIQNTVDVGNSTVHQGFKPDKELAENVFEITFHLLKKFYLQEIDKSIASKKPVSPKYPRKT